MWDQSVKADIIDGFCSRAMAFGGGGAGIIRHDGFGRQMRIVYTGLVLVLFVEFKTS